MGDTTEPITGENLDGGKGCFNELAEKENPF
jgi:hypothetical protein